MVAAGVIAGDNRDAFLWNKKKKKEREETEESGISIPQFSIGLTYNTQPFIRLTLHTLLALWPHSHTHSLPWRRRTRT
jgi:hypothetical protein